MNKQNAKLFFYYSKIKNKFFTKQVKEQYKCDDFSYNLLLNDFDIVPKSHIFIHAGLKSIKKVTTNDYNNITQEIIKTLKELYTPSALVAPAFTPSFRKCGVYSKLYSKGEYGVFSELFRKNSSCRTKDAIHSVSIISDDIEKFKILNDEDSFGSNSFYDNFHKDTYILNISTEHFVATYIHYIEELLKVPYKNQDKCTYSGVLYDEDNRIQNIKQRNHAYKYNVDINRKKINKLLVAKNIIKYKNYSGISISCIKVSDLIEVLNQEIIKNPYYLVSF